MKKQTNKQTNKQIGRQADRQTCKGVRKKIQTDKDEIRQFKKKKDKR